MPTLTFAGIVSAFGAGTKAKLDNPAVSGAPEDSSARRWKLCSTASRRPSPGKRICSTGSWPDRSTNWLPDEEAAQLRFAFEAENKRLDAA